MTSRGEKVKFSAQLRIHTNPKNQEDDIMTGRELKPVFLQKNSIFHSVNLSYKVYLLGAES